MACGGGGDEDTERLYDGEEDTDRFQDETFDFLCSMCTSKNKNKEAEKYCVDCQDYYCSTCVKFHEDVPALTKHKILDKGMFQPATSQTLPAIPNERCDKHMHNHVDMYCENHDVVECPTCMATEHRSCHPIFYIPEFLKNKRIPSTAQVMGGLEVTATKVKKYRSDTESKKYLMMKGKAELLQKVKNVRKSINDRLNVLEQGSIKWVEEMYRPVLEKVQNELKKLQAIEDSVSSAKNNLVPTHDNVSQDFVSIKKGETLIKYAEKCFADLNETRMCTADKDFVADPTLLEKLETMNVLGQSLYKVKGKKKYNVKNHTDSVTPSIISACSLENGMVILADSRNKNLKRVDNMTYTVSDYTEVPTVPWQLCLVSKNEVAVSCTHFGVQFVSLQPKLIKTKQFRTDHICRGLAYADGYLYISDKTSVYIYSVSGKKLQQFTGTTDQPQFKWPFTNIFKPALFSGISSLSVADSGSQIYVTDHDSGLTVLDRNGKVTGKYNCAQMTGARYVCQVENGNILVLGRTSPRPVLQIGPGCELIGEVLKADEEINSCQAICYNHFNCKLIVTYSQQNEIEVYDFT